MTPHHAQENAEAPRRFCFPTESTHQGTKESTSEPVMETSLREESGDGELVELTGESSVRSWKWAPRLRYEKVGDARRDFRFDP